MYEWLAFSLALAFFWIVIYAAKPALRREMLLVSIFTAPLGLTQPLFVPEYWNPPSLFNLAATTGFDVESIIFSFATGGIASVLYEAVSRKEHVRMRKKQVSGRRHRLHLLALLFPVALAVLLYFFSGQNPIYSALIVLLAGSILTIACRPDLGKVMLAGGLLFAALYSAFFISMILAFPDFVASWNVSALSGIAVLGMPVEEIAFAFAFGMLWSSVYEHMLWYRLKPSG